jgi:hypothetical protein
LIARTLGTAIAIACVVLLLGGCAAYDYFQHTDRIAYRAGDAVKANLERETTDPSRASMFDVSGLGKNGPVVPAETQSESTPTPATILNQ